MRFHIVPYKRGSASARMLAEKLSSLVGRKVWRGVPKSNRKNIFWGWVGNHQVPSQNCINPPQGITKARDKLLTFQALDGHVPIPEYTTDFQKAAEWIADGKKVFARTRTGQGGSGITVCSDSLVDAPLYTLYVKKRKEFRVHVVKGEVVQVMEKRKRRGFSSDPLIRSHLRGWVFCTQNIDEPDGLRDVAIKAVSSLGLDFGGVDIIWNEKQNKCYVLEVNSAPGLSPQTGDLYANRLFETL